MMESIPKKKVPRNCVSVGDKLSRTNILVWNIERVVSKSMAVATATCVWTGLDWTGLYSRGNQNPKHARQINIYKADK
jgi:hypothetical protein